MSEYLIQGETLMAIADAIRAKNGSESRLSPAQMAEAIAALLDASDATAGAEQLLSGFTAYNDDGKIEGTMPNNGAVSHTFSGDGSYTVPKGYHNGEGVVKAAITKFGLFSKAEMFTWTPTEATNLPYTVLNHSLGVVPDGMVLIQRNRASSGGNNGFLIIVDRYNTTGSSFGNGGIFGVYQGLGNTGTSSDRFNISDWGTYFTSSQIKNLPVSNSSPPSFGAGVKCAILVYKW